MRTVPTLRSSAGPIALLLLFLSVLPCASGQANTSVIQTIQDLQDMQNNLSGNYILGNDIDASVTATWNGTAGFLPVGSAAAPFTGTLNGNGHRITGLFINSGQANVGLFGSAGAGAVIENVDLAKVNITGTGGGSETGGTGALIGYLLNGQVNSCSVAGTVTGTSTGNFVGGLVGWSNGGKIDRSSANVAVSVPGYGTAGGGLVGLNTGTITNSIATGSVVNPGQGGGEGGLAGENQLSGLIINSQANVRVTGNSDGGGTIAAVGGLVGYNSASIFQSSATGATIGTNNSFVGGLVGYNAVGVVQQCFATGSVSNGYGGTGGGVAGLNTGTIAECLTTGAVSNPNTGGGEGGLVGDNESNGGIADSYATGSVSGQSQAAVGGLVGYNGSGSPQIVRSYSIGIVNGASATCSGGLVACNSGGTVSSSYWDTQTSGMTTSAAGIGETTAELQSGTLPAGFDSATWATQPGLFPFLSLLGSAPTIVTITSSQNPSAFGQSVTLMATISPVLPGAASTPTGTVTFVDDNSIETVSVNGGVAVLTTSAFAPGVHRIIASYSGDSSFNASQSSEAGYTQFVASP